jgi:predicted HicB family RNase H-like nuclease
MKKLLVILVLLVASAVWAGEKETLAIQVFTLQEEIATIQDQFKAKQGEFLKTMAAMKKEPDQAKKGQMAVRLMDMETELVKLAERSNTKTAEQAEARKKFKELVEKETKK